MKKIHFDHLEKNYWALALILLSLPLIFIEELPLPFEFENANIYKYLRAGGFFLQVVYWSRLFWFSNTVQWNKKGMVIRVQSFWGKSLQFKDIKATELQDKQLIITKTDDEKIIMDLKDINETDTHQLHEIIVKQAAANGY